MAKYVAWAAVFLIALPVVACGGQSQAEKDAAAREKRQQQLVALQQRKAEQRRQEAEQRRQEAEQRKQEAEQRRQEAERRKQEAERRAAEHTRLLNAPTIPYADLNKDADAFKGKPVSYTGKVFQAQEEGDTGFMLLSVTNEGYDIWDDHVWVNYKAPKSFVREDAMVTIHGYVVGSKSYDTQIGGSTYVPEVNAKIVTP